MRSGHRNMQKFGMGYSRAWRRNRVNERSQFISHRTRFSSIHTGLRKSLCSLSDPRRSFRHKHKMRPTLRRAHHTRSHFRNIDFWSVRDFQNLNIIPATAEKTINTRGWNFFVDFTRFENTHIKAKRIIAFGSTSSNIFPLILKAAKSNIHMPRTLTPAAAIRAVGINMQAATPSVKWRGMMQMIVME